MKRTVRSLVLMLLFLWTPVASAESLLIGILEEPQCQNESTRAVRPLFAKKNTEWIALDSKKTAAGFKLDRIEWIAAFDGRSIGQFVSIDPKREIPYEWTYPRDYRQVLESPKTLPDVMNKSKAFSGWCEAPQYFPIVLVTSPNFQDPEQWKPASVPMVDRQKLLLAFREATKQARLCEASEHEKPRPYIYGVKDLQIAAAFKNALGRQLVSVTLRKKYIECGSERGWADSPQWFFLGETIRSIGNNLSLIDAGDYDKDGRSEVVFWYSGYNRDGYVLLYDNFTKRTDFVWTYH